MIKLPIKIILIYLISLTAALIVFFYIQNQPAGLSRQIFSAYQNFIWFNPADSPSGILGKQKIKQITIANLEPLRLSLLIKLDSPEYLPKIEKLIKTAVSQKTALKFPQTEEVILPDKTILRQKVAKPADFVWQEKKIKPGLAQTWSQMTLNVFQKEDNYFGYVVIDLLDQTETNTNKILALTIDKNILANLEPGAFVLKLEKEKNLFYIERNFLNLIQENSANDLIFEKIDKLLIRGDQNGFKIEVK